MGLAAIMIVTVHLMSGDARVLLSSLQHIRFFILDTLKLIILQVPAIFDFYLSVQQQLLRCFI